MCSPLKNVPEATSPANAETVIVSIVTWNHGDSIAACLDSVLRQTRKPEAIHVFDNASADDTRAVLERFRDRSELNFNKNNVGFCGGHNFLINSTQSAYVLLVNPDVVMEPEWIERALDAMRSDRKIGTVCGLLLQGREAGDSEVIDGSGLLFSRSRRFLLRDYGKRRSEVPRSAGDVFGTDGALPFFRRAMIDDVSMDGFFFDPEFFAHKEDHDVAWRARLLGWKTFFEPACVALHPRVFRPGDLALRRALSPEVKYHAVKNDLLMLLKNERFSDFVRDFFHIVPRRVAIAVYALFIEPRSVAACGYVLRRLRSILRQRKEIQNRRRITAAEMRRWLA